jgi:hypothetical protein
MKDPFSIFIGDSVYYTKIQYYKLINDTKMLLFKCLNEEKSLKEFKEKAHEIWGDVNHDYMEQAIKELEQMIDQKNGDGHNILNPNAEFKEVYMLDKESKYIDIEKKYEKAINNYYKARLKTINNGFVDKETYLAKMLNKYDEMQAIIPYKNKNGDVVCYHNIASYLSMVYNTNLTKAGWNRTIYDSKLFGNDLVYLPAHTGACPRCMEFQGQVYSISGKNPNYLPQSIAIDGGVGHPNCKHEWVLYWGEYQIQEDKFDSPEWEEYYVRQQKIQSLQLERTNLKVNKKVFEDLGNYGEVDKINAKIKKLNAKIKDLK